RYVRCRQRDLRARRLSRDDRRDAPRREHGARGGIVLVAKAPGALAPLCPIRNVTRPTRFLCSPPRCVAMAHRVLTRFRRVRFEAPHRSPFRGDASKSKSSEVRRMITEAEFRAFAAQGFNRIPMVLDSFADLDTPLSLYLKLANQRYTFLLES